LLVVVVGEGGGGDAPSSLGEAVDMHLAAVSSTSFPDAAMAETARDTNHRLSMRASVAEEGTARRLRIRWTTLYPVVVFVGAMARCSAGAEEARTAM
jgi:hypothetical protein